MFTPNKKSHEDDSLAGNRGLRGCAGPVMAGWSQTADRIFSLPGRGTWGPDHSTADGFGRPYVDRPCLAHHIG